MKSLVSTEWLDKNLENVRIFDASWHLPVAKRDAFQEYKESHIKNSSFFDIDKNSNQNSSLPHMLTNKEEWEKILSKYGINNSDHVIIYDNSDVISSCRVWYNFLYFGHNSNLISILDGGLKKWVEEKRSTFKEIKKLNESNLLELINLNEELTWKDKLNKTKALNINIKELKLIRINHFKHFIDKFENDLISKISSYI